MIQIKDIKLKIDHDENALRQKIFDVCKLKGYGKGSVKFEYKLIRQSIDARKKPDIYYIYSVAVDFGVEESKIIKYLRSKRLNNIVFEAPVEYRIPQIGEKSLDKRPVIVGSGPAGLFVAYVLAQRGFNPIVIERGESVEDRINTVNKTFTSGSINNESNVQFGEGGAGTFSDGKLNTLTKDINGRNSYVLKTFAKFGAKENITYQAKPHIGTDQLTKVVANMRNEIIKLGGQFMFSTKLIDFEAENHELKAVKIVDVISGREQVIETDICVLCIGHSARDTFELLYNKQIEMEQKSFAVGFRVAHRQELVNMWQLGVRNTKDIGLEAADYKVTNECSNNRRVYSFCMCPGGYVVNASSEKGRMCVNGMSESQRDSEYANSAIICAITPQDFKQDVVSGNHPLSGMYFQRIIEERAYNCGDGNIPVQYFKDFCKNRVSDDFNYEGCTKGLVRSGNLREILDDEINHAIIESMHKFGYTRKGFDDDNTLMYGIEARTSSPIRIQRNEDFESVVSGLYPCGEGAGYAGGITSAATDGIKVAEAIITKYKPCY